MPENVWNRCFSWEHHTEEVFCFGATPGMLFTVVHLIENVKNALFTTVHCFEDSEAYIFKIVKQDALKRN